MKLIALYSIFFLFCLNFTISAQTSELPWNFSINANTISLQGKGTDSGFNIGAPVFVLSRKVFGGLSFGSQYALGQVDNFQQSYNYSSWDGFLKLNLSEGRISTYLIGGYGFSQFADGMEREGVFPSTETSRTLFGGVGVNYNLNSHFALNLQVAYRDMDETNGFNHLQNFIGLGYNFGSKDTDKDGVPDKNDQCPTVPGPKEYNGCPDTDGDTVIDKEDKCPDIYGLPELMGCNDTDGDGVLDHEDICPELMGKVEMKGCPDTDGDGLSDRLDSCIDQAGPKENKGCPWPDSDGDGIVDPEDKCKDEAGPLENDGCPLLSEEIMQTLNEFGSRINFAADSYEIFGAKTREHLLKIKDLLESNPHGVLLIEGYASEEGEQNYNLELSVNRALAVRQFLIGIGVNPSRLEVQGFGASDPIGDNSRPEGRAINRRVQFKIKKN